MHPNEAIISRKNLFLTTYIKFKFKFKVRPFGLKNARAIFQRIPWNIIRRNNLDEFYVNYIDDVLIFSKSWDDHFQHLGRVFDATESEGLKLKLAKCTLQRNLLDI